MRSMLRALSFTFAVAALLAHASAHAQVQQPPPVIERLEPTSGPPGTVVQMIGRYFRPDQRVRIAGQDVEMVSQLPNRWTIRIPQGARSGRIAIEVPGVATTIGPEFRVLAAAPPPVIADLAPRVAAPGAEVRLIGENFSPRISENLVTLNGAAVVVRSATPNELVVIVPSGARSGRFAVRVAGSGEAAAPFDLQIGEQLQIASFTPAIGAPGTQVTIAGSGFAPHQRGQRVFLGSVPCPVVSASPNALVVQIPPGATTGLFMVDVRRVGRAYASQPFVVQAAPQITGIEPAAGPPGTRVRIRGSGFGNDVRVVSVAFGTVSATVRGLRDEEIVVEVPSGASSGAIQVVVNGIGPALSPSAFTVVQPPSIADFEPRSGPVGSEIVIRGGGFGAVAAHNTVTISRAPAEVLAASPTELRVRVPATASGPIQVDVLHAGTARSAQPFVITTPPVITRIEPEQGLPGSILTIHGASFGTNPGLVEVALGDRRMHLRSVSEQRIEAIVPEGAVSGRVRVTVRLQGSATSPQVFAVLGTFAVTSVEPASAHPGQWLTIRGSGFAPSGMEVRFAGVSAPVPYSFVSAAEIRVVVPAGAQTGTLTVRSADGRVASPGVGITPPPSGLGITEVEAECLRAGCNAVVHGYGFGLRPGDQQVTFAGQRVRVRRASPNALEISFPRRFVGTATVRVQLRSGAATESAPITITP